MSSVVYENSINGLKTQSIEFLIGSIKYLKGEYILMGCYDMIIANTPCPYCGHADRIVVDQTKEFGCTFKDLGLGDVVSGYDLRDDYGTNECSECKGKYDYTVTYDYGRMTSIVVRDKIFNKTYTYKDKRYCKNKKISIEQFENLVVKYNKLNEEFQDNQKTIKRLEICNNSLSPQIEMLKGIIDKAMCNVFT